ncbi:MAG: hypothetical protein VKK63_07080, partial [Synechococcus sp.]|nr:hypothetical protein [Synechococcus sp.]
MDLFETPGRRRRSEGYIPLFDEATLADERVGQDAVTQAERDSILRQVGELTGGTLSRVGDILSMPGDYARGLLSGRAGERVTGRELLREYGLAGEEDNWGNFAAGMVTDMVTDPLALVSGPAGSLTKAGAAAKKLNLLDNAATVATKKAISSGATDLPMVARNTRKALEGTGRKLSTFDPAVTGRPLYGTRTARRATTLDDLIKYADDPAAAEKAARELLGDSFDSVRNQTLSKTFGVGLPLQDPAIVGDLFGKGFGDKYADVLDTVGQSIRWSYPGRLASAAFDNRVGGRIDAEEQITNIANFGARNTARSVAKNADTYMRAKLYEAHPEVFESEEANRIIGRVIEGKNAIKPGDLAYVAARPELENYINWVKNTMPDALDESKRVGLSAAELVDDYGMEYLPRKAEAALEMAGKRDKKLGDALSTMTGDMLRRTEAMQLPGGRDTIIDLSRDPMVAGGKRALDTDDEAAEYIMNLLSPLPPPPPGLSKQGNQVVVAGQPLIDRDKATRLARVLHALPEDVVQKSPLFGQHPVETIGSYLTGRAESAATMNTMYDSLATFAIDSPYNKVPGGRSISLQEALNRIGSRTYKDGDDVLGGATQMRERLARLRGVDPDEIRLADVAIPEEHVNRLVRARDAYETGEASSAVLNWLDHYTSAWKGSILTWPARSVRDLYSGAISNWLEGALEPDAIFAAKALLSEGPESSTFRTYLAKLPQYAGEDGMARFYADLSAQELVGGPAALELGSSTIGRRALDPIIGADPLSVGDAVAELAPQSGRTWQEFGNDFMTWRSNLRPTAETMNPVLRTGEKMNSLTDGINRLSGYLSLLKQGYDPAAAGKAMKRAHVDFSSLSGFEKTLLRRIFPWYSFQSRIFKEVLRQMAARPGGRYGQMIMATERMQDSDDTTYVPSGLRSQFALPLPDMLGGEPAPGTTRFLTDIDAPGFDQINMIETPGTLAGTVQGTGRQIGMQLAPFIRAPIEGMFGTDLFTNRPLGEATGPLDAIGRSVTGDPNFDVPAVIDKTVELLPFVGRPLYAARSLLDTRGDAPLSSRAAKTLVNATTGIKFRDVAQEDALADAVRQIEESIDPYTREFKQVYIPENLQPNVPQWAL